MILYLAERISSFAITSQDGGIALSSGRGTYGEVSISEAIREIIGYYLINNLILSAFKAAFLARSAAGLSLRFCSLRE